MRVLYESVNPRVRAFQARLDALHCEAAGYPGIAQVNRELAFCLDPPPLEPHDRRSQRWQTFEPLPERTINTRPGQARLVWSTPYVPKPVAPKPFVRPQVGECIALPARPSRPPHPHPNQGAAKRNTP